VEADAMAIPDEIEISIQDLEVGTRVLAGEVPLPPGVELRTDPEYLLINIVASTTGNLGAEGEDGTVSAGSAD
ncbi:MAG: 50S ribosomal protein L25/general stress protein Ctc, partial [Pseudonocardiaceae bacterium]